MHAYQKNYNISLLYTNIYQQTHIYAYIIMFISTFTCTHKHFILLKYIEISVYPYKKTYMYAHVYICARK